MLKIGLNKCTNAEYHADKEFLSSSNYKTLLTDPAKFHKEKILGIKEERKESASFTEGSLTHSLILEPHMIKEEYAFYEGLRKAGADYEKFVAANPGKTIISKPQKIKTDSYKQAYLKCPSAVKLVQGGESEATICAILSDIPTKVRCDYINVEKGYIADVKTSSYPIDHESFKLTIEKWSYDLSAALYRRVAELHYGKKFDFYFIAIGKNPVECAVYKASEKTLEKGMLQITKAASIYKECKKTGIWELEKAPTVEFNDEILEV